MEFIRGQALIELLNLADFELFTLAAAGVIPSSPEGKPLETPWSGATYEMRVKSMRKLDAGCEYCSTTIFNEPLDPIPKTWADLNSGQGTTSIRAVLLSELREAMFLFDQLPEGYRKAIAERQIETQQAMPVNHADNSQTSREIIRAYALGFLESKRPIKRGELAEKIKENLPQAAAYEVTYLTDMIRDLFPDYTPGKPGRKTEAG